MNKLKTKWQTSEQCFKMKPVFSGQPVIADTLSWNRPNHGQSLIENPLYSGQFYSEHNFWHRVKISS